MALGWVVDPDFQGRGYATEAARAVMRFAFDEICAHRVYAQVDPRKAASVALCLRPGMRLEATLIEREIFKGEWGDLAVYAVLEREWAATERALGLVQPDQAD